jgi:hypothetical protein
MTTFMGDEHDAIQPLGAYRESHDLKDQVSFRTRERRGSARPEHDLRLREESQTRHQRPERLLEPVVAARQYEGATPTSSGRARTGSGYESPYEIGHLVVLGARSLQWSVTPHPIDVPSPISPPLQVSGPDEIGHDRLNRSWCDPHFCCDLAEAEVRVLRKREEDVAVVRKEGPGRGHAVNLGVRIVRFKRPLRALQLH